MKRRLFYFISSSALIISLLASFAFTGTASAAYVTDQTTLGQQAATWCSNHQYSNENYCNEPYILGYNFEPTPSKVSAEETKECGSIANASSKSMCTDAFNAGVDQAKSDSGSGTTTTKEQGTQYCVDQYPNSQTKATACTTIYNHVLNDSTNDSATYCKSPPGGFSTTTCNTIYQAALQNKPGGDTGATGQPGDPASGSGNGSTATTPTCEASGFSASWVLCPVFNLVSDGAGFIFNSILQPFLVTQPISTKTSDPTYQIWSNFRIYGDIFLIIALLIVVFGESIGGGLIDAYTAKKILPRLLTAAILINLSIYIVAALVDATNILGKGISGILTAPLTNCTAGAGNCWNFSLSNTDIVSVFGVGLVGFLATSTAIAGFLGSVLFGGTVAVTAAFTAAFFIAIPMLFAVLGVFLTLIFRKGLILFLVLISPVAFALYVLPNTERHFKRWWDLLVEALMIYPIIVLIFGVADILSITLLQANSIAPSSFTGHVSFDVGRTLALVAAFLLQFLPLFAIPFSFRFASGALGRVYGAATSAGGVAHKALTGRREQAKRDYGAQHNAARDRLYNAGNALSNKYFDDPNAKNLNRAGNFIARKGSRWMASKAGGYNIQAIQSAARAETAKQINEEIASGVDPEIRGLTADKAKALQGRGARKDGDNWVDIASGQQITEDQLNDGTYDYRVNTDDNGNVTGRDFTSMGGAWVDEASVDRGHDRWGRNQYAQQAALSYEMRKASTNGQRQRIRREFMSTATASGSSGWGMSKAEAKGVWTGAGFENQNSNLQYKYYNPETGVFDHKGFVSEVYEKRGSYDMSRMDAETISLLGEAFGAENTTPETRQQLGAIARTMQERMASSRANTPGVTPAEDGNEATPGANALGPGHVSDAMTNFVNLARENNVLERNDLV